MTATLSKQQQLQDALSTLRASMPELRGALVATTDGLPIATSFADNTDANRVAAMAATALGLAKRIGDTLSVGGAQETSVTGSDGQVFFYTIGHKGVLAVVTPASVNLGLLRMEARDTAQMIASVL